METTRDGPIARSVKMRTSEATEDTSKEKKILEDVSSANGTSVTACEDETEQDWETAKDQEVLVGAEDCEDSSYLDWSFLEEGHLFGRNTEVEALQEAFARHRSSDNEPSNSTTRRELVLVSGKSGSGKTALVKTALQDLTLEHHGFFLIGKFDQLQGTSEPFAAFVAILTQLAISLGARTLDIRENILEHVGLETCHVLCALAPYLGRVLGLNQERVALKTHDAQQDRLKIALSKLFHEIIESRNVPVILVMDDLQWADSASLELLEALVADAPEQTNTFSKSRLMVVGICRSNEVPWHHDFAGMLRRLEDEKDTDILHIQVQNLTLEATNQLLSTLLKQPLRQCRPLASIVHEKSEHGNVFFMLQLLKTLLEEQVLVAKTAEPGKVSTQREWLWDDDKWGSLTLLQQDNLDIADLVSKQLQQKPESCQELLKVAACLGAKFDGAILGLLLGKDKAEVAENMAVALKERMISEQMHCSGSYAFAHDRIQQAAYSLIPVKDRPMSHLVVGRSLLQQLSPEDLETNLCLVVNQLIQGITLLTAEEDKLGLSQLCLRAGKKASQASDFETSLAIL